MIYLLNFNITHIIILATCFDSYESSSGINFQKLLYHIDISSGFVMHKGIPIAIVRLRQKILRHKTVKQYVQ